MAEEPDQIRNQIEETRDEMTGTVREIAHRANVTERMGDALHRARREWFGHPGEGQSVQERELLGPEGAAPGASRFQRLLLEKPAQVLGLAFAAGMFMGMRMAIRAMGRRSR